ncbi:hypothetical protein DFH06DRAFT_536413 [Mycena polygramma]|nr:hypothetical protein DFH06DRAFT_536413 [Mycena polygramma]
MVPAVPSHTNGNASGSGGGGENRAEKSGEKEKGRRRRNKDKGDKGSSGPATPAPPAPSPAARAQQTRRVQAAQLAHLLALHTALLRVGVTELGEVDMYSGLGAGGAGAGAGAATTNAAVQSGEGRGGGRGRRAERYSRARRQREPAAASASAAAATTGAGVGGMNGGAGAKPELAERISAEFRRTLPALRVASKWVLGNWGWMADAAASSANGSKAHVNAKDGGEGESMEEIELRAQRARFWTTYAEFLRRLARTFPGALLPRLSEPLSTSASGGDVAGAEVGEGAEEDGEEEVELELELEEDIDMRGWLPLHGLMGGPCPLPPFLLSSTGAAGEENDGAEGRERERRTVGLREEVHPNVEQLMRIADLLRDARKVVALEGSPLALYGGQFVVKGVEAAKPVGATATSVLQPSSAPVFVPAAVRLRQLVPEERLASFHDIDGQDDDAMTEQTSRTDDDILHDAFSFLNRAESEAADASDEDEIVWDLRDAPVSPILPTARTSPKTPVRPPPIGPPPPRTVWRWWRAAAPSSEPAVCAPAHAGAALPGRSTSSVRRAGAVRRARAPPAVCVARSGVVAVAGEHHLVVVVSLRKPASRPQPWCCRGLWASALRAERAAAPPARRVKLDGCGAAVPERGRPVWVRAAIGTRASVCWGDGAGAAGRVLCDVGGRTGLRRPPAGPRTARAAPVALDA